MRLALRELHRRPGRFAVATAILTLIALLLMFLGGLLDGLVRGSTGALRAQRADLVVFSATARKSLVRSRVGPALARTVAAVPGVAGTGGLGSVQLGARVPGHGVRDLVPVVLFGYARAPRGLPGRPPPPGEVYADDALRSEGVRAGEVVRLGPARSPVRVVGFVTDTRYTGQGTLWGSLATWHAVLAANRPAARLAGGVVQALVVDVAPGRRKRAVARSIDAATAGATRTLTVRQAIDALPGVRQQRSVFTQIIGVTVVIAIVVVALFFALVTVERSALYGVLKAIGASTGTLFAGVVVQAVVVTSVACLLAGGAAFLLDALIPPGGVPFVATAPRVLGSAGVLLLAAVAGCAFSLRRVLRVDPATAIGGGA